MNNSEITRRIFIVLIFTFVFLLYKAEALFSAPKEIKLHPFVVYEKKGLYSNDGKIIITPQFDDIEPFAEGLAVVRSGGKYNSRRSVFVNANYGYIDETGKLVIPTLYDQADAFSEGLAPVKEKNGKWGYINRSGTMVINPIYEVAYPFSEGLAQVQPANSNGRFGYIDKTGTLVIEAKFQYDDETRRFHNNVQFHEGLAAVKDSASKKYGFIDKSGQFVIAPKFEYAYAFRGGRAQVKVSKDLFDGKSQNKYGLIDRNGNFVIPPQFNWIGGFEDGIAKVRVEEKYPLRKDGLIDYYSGKVILEPEFEDIRDFSEDLAAVRLHNKWGYIDKTGKIVIKPQFVEASSFSDGLAAVRFPDNKSKSGKTSSGKYGYIDKFGKLIIQPRFEGSGWFHDGITAASIVVKKGAGAEKPEILMGYIDKTGSFVIQPVFESGFGFNGPYASFTKIYRKDREGKVLSSEQGLIDKAGRVVWSEKRDTGKKDRWEKGYVMVNMVKGTSTVQPRIVIKKFKKGTVDNEYPQFEAMPDITLQKRLNRMLRSEYYTETSDPGTDYSGRFAIYWNKNSIVSLVIDTYFYGHGTPHGYPTLKGNTINITTGMTYNLEDIFTPNTDWLKRLDGIVRKKMQKKIDEDELSLSNPFEGIEGSENFYLSDQSNSLVIFYNVYEIASYACGVVKIEIPLKDLRDIVKPEFITKLSSSERN